MDSNKIIETETVVIKLPFLLGIKKKVGFTFNILSYAYVCELLDINFWQIDEIRQSNPKKLFETMALAGALSYQFSHKTTYKVDIKLIDKWLNKSKHEDSVKLADILNVAILNGMTAIKSIEKASDHVKKK